jgi:uncharacterized protein
MLWLSRFITTHRLFVWGLVVLLSIPALCGLLGYRPLEERSFEWGTDDVTSQLEAAQATFGGNYSGFQAFAVLECEDFFQPDRLAALRRAAQRVDESFAEAIPDFAEQNPDSRPFVWIGSIEHASVFGRQTVLPDVVETAEDARFAEELVSEHPLIDGQLLSDDHRTMLAGLNIAWLAWSDVELNKFRAALRAELEPVGITVRLTGPGPLFAARKHAFDTEHSRILFTTAALIVGLALVIFRGLPAIIIACSGPFFGVFWTVGWLALLGQGDNELAKIILPVMILMVSFTDGVHVVVHIRQHRAASDGDPDRSLLYKQIDAAASAIRHVGGACLLTSLTTAIGFASLLLSEAEMVQGFGRNCAFGVMIAFVAAILVIPLVSISPVGRRVHKGADRDLVGRHIVTLSGIVGWLVRRSAAVSIASVIVTLLLTLQALRLVPDDRLADRIPNNSEAYLAMQHVDETLGGVRLMRVVVEWPEGADHEAVWKIADEVKQAIAAEPSLAKPLSVRDALSVLPGADGPEKLRLARLLPTEFRETFWNEDERRTQILSRCQDIGIARYQPVLARLDAQFRALEAAHPGFHIELTGEAIVESGIVRRVVDELFQSLILAAVVIFVVITVAIRSIRFGLLSIIPNVFPLVLTGAMRASFNTSLDISSACSFAICLGIAVDDTIHFLMRFRHERKQGHDIETAIRNTFVTVGSALVMTTVVMVTGLASVMTSDMPTHLHFAAMACSTIGAALIGDLVMLPALLARFAGKAT